MVPLKSESNSYQSENMFRAFPVEAYNGDKKTSLLKNSGTFSFPSSSMDAEDFSWFSRAVFSSSIILSEGEFFLERQDPIGGSIS